MPINIQNLTNELQPTLDAISNTVTADELLLISNSLQKLDTDRIPSVANTDSLPLLYDDGTEESLFPSGQVYYVDEFDVPVISVNNKWIGLDGRVLRYDEPRQILYAFGSSYDGQLGTGDTTNQSSPVTVAGGITNWTQIGGGTNYSFGITGDGLLYSWGDNNYGVLGNGTGFTGQNSPVTVVGGITNWNKVSSGYQHALGLTDTGILYGWGRNFSGQVGGNNTNPVNDSPVTVVGGITNWNNISAGQKRSFGTTNDGLLYAWGDGSGGQLGTNGSTYHSSPVTVAGGITNWSDVAAGYFHTLALTDTGVLYAWGTAGYSNPGGTYNTGRLGTNDDVSQSSPVTVVGGVTNWIKIAVGRVHSLGLTDTGVLYAWGGGYSPTPGPYFSSSLHGQTGVGTTQLFSSPVTVVGGITNWSNIAAGSQHSLGLTDTGVLYAWGDGGSGKLGTNDEIDRSSPVTVAGGITNWSKIAAPPGHSFAISES